MVFDRRVSGLLLQVFVSCQLSRHVRKWRQSALVVFLIMFVLQAIARCWPVHLLVVAVYLQGAGLWDLDLTLRSLDTKDRKGGTTSIASPMTIVIPTVH